MSLWTESLAEHRFSGLSQPRQCGEEVLRMLVTGGLPLRSRDRPPVVAGKPRADDPRLGARPAHARWEEAGARPRPLPQGGREVVPPPKGDAPYEDQDLPALVHQAAGQAVNVRSMARPYCSCNPRAAAKLEKGLIQIKL